MEINGTRYPIGVQSFEKVRRGGYAYIDKTEYIPKLLSNDYYFLSRPRRFGKSLLLSTLEAYFRGKKELFEGLEVEKYEHEWVEYPVIHVDFASMNGTDTEAFVGSLKRVLKSTAKEYRVDLEPEYDRPEDIFALLLEALFDKYGRKVVILIDEYDKGIIEVLQDCNKMEEATRVLRPFFSVLKSHDRYIRFAFITGVSRFRNTTIFSGFNNLYDISMDPEFAAICGITRDELTASFTEGIAGISRRYGFSTEETVEVLVQKYDGYRFTLDKVFVFNPFSILNVMKTSILGNYWVMSGSSKILVDYIRQSNIDLGSMTSGWVREELLGSTYSTENPLSLFFQTGYLTIADWDGDDSYRLRIPNQEVQSALAHLFVPEYTGCTPSHIDDDLRKLRMAVNSGDVQSMMGTLTALTASVPYHEIVGQPLEKHLHLCMYIIFMMLGTNTRCEVASSAGRCDMVAQTPWKVYVFEFKLDTDPAEALRQIDEKGYAISWEARGRDVIKIGVNFSSKLRCIDTWKQNRL